MNMIIWIGVFSGVSYHQSSRCMPLVSQLKQNSHIEFFEIHQWVTCEFFKYILFYRGINVRCCCPCEVL